MIRNVLTTRNVRCIICMCDTICAERGVEMNKELIGKKLLVLRGNRTREEVAEAVNISVSALQMYENGKRIPRDDIKIKLAGYFGTSVQEIFFNPKQHSLSC